MKHCPKCGYWLEQDDPKRTTKVSAREMQVLTGNAMPSEPPTVPSRRKITAGRVWLLAVVVLLLIETGVLWMTSKR